METKERNMVEEESTVNEELLHKKEFLSDEALRETAGGWEDGPVPGPICNNCINVDRKDLFCVTYCNRENKPR